jgi:hypothetical protein
MPAVCSESLECTRTSSSDVRGLLGCIVGEPGTEKGFLFDTTVDYALLKSTREEILHGARNVARPARSPSVEPRTVESRIFEITPKLFLFRKGSAGIGAIPANRVYCRPSRGGHYVVCTSHPGKMYTGCL